MLSYLPSTSKTWNIICKTITRRLKVRVKKADQLRSLGIWGKGHISDFPWFSSDWVLEKLAIQKGQQVQGEKRSLLSSQRTRKANHSIIPKHGRRIMVLLLPLAYFNEVSHTHFSVGLVSGEASKSVGLN